MKNRFIMSIVFLIGIFLAEQNAMAQASNKNKRQLHINKKGEVRNDRGTTLGYISKEDVVFNNQGEKLGFIENGKVYDALGNPLGKAKKNGKYINNQGINVLRVKGKDEICEILDPEGHKLGTVHKNYKLHSCATHCFFLKQNPEDEKK